MEIEQSVSSDGTVNIILVQRFSKCGLQANSSSTEEFITKADYWPYPRLTKSDTLRVGPSNLGFCNFFPSDTDAVQSVRTTFLGCHLHFKLGDQRPREQTCAESIQLIRTQPFSSSPIWSQLFIL